MTKRKTLPLALCSLLLALCALPAAAQTHTHTSIERKASKVRIDATGQVRIEPRPDKSITFTRPLEYTPTAYTGTSSYQPVAIDLNLGAAAGGTTGKFLAPMMGNILGTNLSKAGNYLGGGIFHYNVAGTNATTYPSGAVLGGIGDGTTTAKCAFCAYIDGDSALTTADAAFRVMNNNSTGGSKFAYGLDLFGAARDGYNAVSFSAGDIRFSDGTVQNTADAGGGDVVGPASATADAFTQFNGTTGKLIKSGVTLDVDTALAGNSDVRVASQKAVKAYADTKQAALTNPLVGVDSGYKIARGVSSITGSGDVVTGLTTVVSITVTPQDDLDGDTFAGASATVGNQAGAPAAGSVTIKTWKVTTGGAAGNPTLIPASAAKSVNWIAIGT